MFKTDPPLSPELISPSAWSRTETVAKLVSVRSACQSWNLIRTLIAAQDFLVSLPLKER